MKKKKTIAILKKTIMSQTMEIKQDIKYGLGKRQGFQEFIHQII